MRSISWAILMLVCLQSAMAQLSDTLLLKDYQPRSIYNLPQTSIQKAKWPVIDAHAHPYATSEEEMDEWVAVMDRYGIEKTILLTYSTGARFDSLISVYSKYPGRFDLWCGIDFTGYNQSGWSEQAIKELKRCHQIGAKGVGELGDKGLGLVYSKPTPAHGMHLDDPRLQPILKMCGELKLPVNVHVAEPKWMYEPIDRYNDGLINAEKWRIDLTKHPLTHKELINTLENAVKKNPETTFIACHFANCSYDLSIIGKLMDENQNIYADISARYGETATIPRYMKEFYQTYQDRLLFGTDMGLKDEMYQVVLRILESEDEHIYQQDYFNYHWPLQGFGLSEAILKKLYHDNAQKIFNP